MTFAEEATRIVNELAETTKEAMRLLAARQTAQQQTLDAITAYIQTMTEAHNNLVAAVNSLAAAIMQMQRGSE